MNRITLSKIQPRPTKPPIRNSPTIIKTESTIDNKQTPQTDGEDDDLQVDDIDDTLTTTTTTPGGGLNKIDPKIIHSIKKRRRKRKRNQKKLQIEQ